MYRRRQHQKAALAAHIDILRDNVLAGLDPYAGRRTKEVVPAAAAGFGTPCRWQVVVHHLHVVEVLQALLALAGVRVDNKNVSRHGAGHQADAARPVEPGQPQQNLVLVGPLFLPHFPRQPRPLLTDRCRDDRKPLVRIEIRPLDDERNI